MLLPAFMRRHGAFVFAGLACTLFLGTAAAQVSSGENVDANAESGTDRWRVSVGLGVVTRPRYPGSSERRTNALPIISADYGRFFIGGLPEAGLPLGVGVTLLRNGPWRAGISIGADLQKPRKASDSPRLAGMGDIPSTASGTAFAVYDGGFFVARGNVVTDIGGKGEGSRANLDLDARYSPVARLVLSAGPGITWADRKSMQTFFGVTAAQSATSRLARYDASSGLQSIRFGVGAGYRLTANWGLGTRATVTSLRGDAADSPITEKKTQANLAVFANYRF